MGKWKFCRERSRRAQRGEREGGPGRRTKEREGGRRDADSPARQGREQRDRGTKARRHEVEEKAGVGKMGWKSPHAAECNHSGTNMAGRKIGSRKEREDRRIAFREEQERTSRDGEFWGRRGGVWRWRAARDVGAGEAMRRRATDFTGATDKSRRKRGIVGETRGET